MRFVYLTVDLEEWYELDYLKKYELDQSVEVIPEIIDFLDLLDRFQIKATFFVLATVLERNADIVKEICRRGHAIGCHGFDHELLYNKELDEFIDEVFKAKNNIEQSIECKVKGYRASCFSMERDKLNVLSSIGFKYDSSYIKFKQHPLYGDLDLTGFEKADDLVYRNDNFFEYEIPTLKIGNYNIPISGGGYMRLFPLWILKMLIKRYSKQHHNFLMYLHPFELTEIGLPFSKEVGWKEKFRASVGRKKNLKKISEVIKLLYSMGAEFRTFEHDIEERV